MDHRKDQPSVKLHHAPGGQSNFSLAWDDGSSGATKKDAPTVTSPFATHEESKTPVTSVKVHHAPGGQSTFSLGDGSSGATVPSVKLHQAPGGSTSIHFGDGSTESPFQTSSQAASSQIGGGAAQPQIAAGQSQAAGKRNQPPGGRSQITF